MKLQSATLAALCLVASHAAHASGYTVSDLGTGFAALGVVPVPGIGYSPFWGGNTHYSPSAVGSSDVEPGGVTHADLLLSTTRYDLTPALYQYGGVTLAASAEVVGYVGGHCGDACTSGPSHAALWTINAPGSAPGFTDLHPAGYTASLAQGAVGVVQVGWGQDSAALFHPLVWQGTAASAAALPLPGALVQGAAAAGSTQPGVVLVGYGAGMDHLYHPVTWVQSGTGYMPADILPFGATQGVAVATALGSIGGSVITSSSGGQYHAAFWDDSTGADFRDLHPGAHGGVGYSASSIYAMSTTKNVRGIYLVGLAVVNNRARHWHAMIWRGATLAPLDLQRSLGSGFIQSVATGVDTSGNVSGAAQDIGGVWHQIYWGH